MSKDPTEELVNALVEQLPIQKAYDDGLSASVEEAGGALTDIIKTLRLALAPVQYAAALQDRYRAFLDKSVRRIPSENRTQPPPQILGPVIEGIRYEPAGTPIDEMFSQLLSRSMDSHRANEAHPSFPHIIRQLSADEAKILERLNKTSFPFVYTKDWDPASKTFSNQQIEQDGLPRTNLSFPDNIQFYFDHLNALGLAGIYEVRNQEPIIERGKQTGTRAFFEYQLSPLGQRFVSACGE